MSALWLLLPVRIWRPLGLLVAFLVGVGSAALPASAGGATTSPLPSLMRTARMNWNFFYTPYYTVVESLTARGAPLGGTIIVTCHGVGCAFGRRVIPVVKGKRCRPDRKPRCLPLGTYDLTVLFAGRELVPGAHLTVAIRHPGWIGKFYRFQIRPGQGPLIAIKCLAPGVSRPLRPCTA